MLLGLAVGGARSCVFSMPCPAQGTFTLALPQVCARHPEPSPPVSILDVEVGIPYLSPEVGSLWPGRGGGGLTQA